MNRRSFLKILGISAGTAAAAALTPSMLEGFVDDPERLLWVPGEKTLFLPPEKTFTTYSTADLDALARSIGVVRFYDNRGRPRTTAFNRWRPDLALGALSDAEIKMAIETGYALAPGLQSAIRQQGPGQDLRALYTGGVKDHGHYTGRLYTQQQAVESGFYGMGLTAYQHGQSLLHGPFDGHITTQRTDRGLVVIGHRDRTGR